MSEEVNGGDAILDAISAQEEVEGLVVGYVVIASFIDADGEQRIFTDTLEGQKNHQTLGLLAFAMARENHRAASAANALDDDED